MVRLLEEWVVVQLLVDEGSVEVDRYRQVVLMLDLGYLVRVQAVLLRLVRFVLLDLVTVRR